uniref:Arf-GAP domain-containing protein n=1 Tax=Caenorhabditis japonica TaxID=281687 RepID=A0A8R1IQS1_CAEJA
MYSADVLDLITSLEAKECDDCGKKEVEWASVKKGTVICSECFCFHSYLGPSVSYLRHLRKSAWDEEHIRLVHALNASNTNMIWESALYEGSTKFRKPEPQDPSHIKEQFVKEKYEKMTFQPKRGKDEDVENSLNRQLIACARSDFAHVTLR